MKIYLQNHQDIKNEGKLKIKNCNRGHMIIMENRERLVITPGAENWGFYLAAFSQKQNNNRAISRGQLGL